MKTLLKTIILLFILASTFIYSQNNTLEPGAVFLNPNFDKYVGTWKWENNGDSFTIVFKKVYGKLVPTVDVNGDMLIGYHEYKKNGVVIESSLAHINSAQSQMLYTFMASFPVSTPTANELEIGISHLSKNKGINGKVQYLDPTHIKIISYKNYQGIKVNTSTYTYDPAISLPFNIVLTKQ